MEELTILLGDDTVKRVSAILSAVGAIISAVFVGYNRVVKVLKPFLRMKPWLVISIVEVTMKNYSYKKLEDIEKILIKNDIKNRKEQVKKNVKTNLAEHTRQYSLIFAELNTGIQNLDIYINDFYRNSKFEEELFEIFFSESTIEQKLYDIEQLMRSYRNNLLIDLKTNLR